MAKRKKKKTAAKNRNRQRKGFDENKFLTRILIIQTLIQIFKDISSGLK